MKWNEFYDDGMMGLAREKRQEKRGMKKLINYTSFKLTYQKEKTLQHDDDDDDDDDDSYFLLF